MVLVFIVVKDASGPIPSVWRSGEIESRLKFKVL